MASTFYLRNLAAVPDVNGNCMEPSLLTHRNIPDALQHLQNDAAVSGKTVLMLEEKSAFSLFGAFWGSDGRQPIPLKYRLVSCSPQGKLNYGEWEKRVPVAWELGATHAA